MSVAGWLVAVLLAAAADEASSSPVEDPARASAITTEAQAEGAIEGSGDDYKLDDVFGTDFKYARFNAAAAAPRNVSALSGPKRAAHGLARDSWQRARIGAAGDDGSEDPDRVIT